MTTHLEADAKDYLVTRGLLDSTQAVTVTPLAGGVSGDVVAVRGGASDFVVKAPLAKLKVAHDWQADPRRVLSEAAALRIASHITPKLVPAVIDLDDDAYVIVLEAADPAWAPLRDQLMDGKCDPQVAAVLGKGLAQWHSATRAPELLPKDLQDLEAFIKLRIDPFYFFVAEQHHDVAATIKGAAEALLSERSCLVHGDFSPKNILVGTDGVWVLDWEVAHYGCPVFDLSFMLSHLILKSVHRPKFAAGYEAMARAFLGAYREGVGAFLPSNEQVVVNVGCLLLARVDGKSPAQYLTIEESDRIRSLAIEVIRDSTLPVLGLGTDFEGRNEDPDRTGVGGFRFTGPTDGRLPGSASKWGKRICRRPKRRLDGLV